TPGRAHNEAIHILATQGLLGGLALLVLLTGLVVAIVRAWRRSPQGDRPLLLAVGAGTLGFVVQNLFGFTVAGCGTLFVTFAALLSRFTAAIEVEETAAGPVPFAPGVVVAGLLALLVFAVNYETAPSVAGTPLLPLAAALLLAGAATAVSLYALLGQRQRA